MTPALSRFIDMARWMAALLVALHHTHNAFVNHADIMTAPHAAPVYVWWFVTAYPFAHGAVVVFFVLSGFLVGGAVIERARDGKRYLRNYLIDRTSRIYIVLLPVLVLSAALDLIGMHVFAGLGIYEQPLYDTAFRFENLLASVVSLQGIWFAPFGTNMALWSLGMEYWYYIVCGLVVLPLSAGYLAGARWAGCALGVAIFTALALSPTFFLFGALVWALGALVRFAPRPIMRSKWAALLLWLAALAAIRLITRGAIIEAHPLKEAIDSVNALLFANVLLTLRFDEGEGFALCRSKIHAKMADFSYTLYALHMPVLVWLWAISALLFGPDWRLQLATPGHYAFAVLALLVVLIVSYGLSRLTEARTGDLRSWLRRVLPGGDPAPRKAKRFASEGG
jgi:peptidoglycan/LPS O-acetylase OafA/YrhL